MENNWQYLPSSVCVKLRVLSFTRDYLDYIYIYIRDEGTGKCVYFILILRYILLCDSSDVKVG